MSKQAPAAMQPFAEFIAWVVALRHAQRASQPGALFGEILQRLRKLQAEARAAAVSQPAADEALFAVVAWCDEYLMNAGWEGISDLWSQHLLQQELFATNAAGDAFFERMQALDAPPNVEPALSAGERALSVEEASLPRAVYALCLACGFKGRYVYELADAELAGRRERAWAAALDARALRSASAQTWAGVLQPRAASTRRWLRLAPWLLAGLLVLILGLATLVMDQQLRNDAAALLRDADGWLRAGELRRSP